MSRTKPVRYIYAVWESPKSCLVSWHYHPDLGVSFPHIHIYDRKSDSEKAAGLKPNLLHDLNIPSGRVSFEDVIRFLIKELDVLPTQKRSLDWEQVLLETSARIEAHREQKTL